MVEQLDVGAETGTYEIDAFAQRFEIEKLRDLRTAVNRLVRLARVRADRDENRASALPAAEGGSSGDRGGSHAGISRGLASQRFGASDRIGAVAF
jgi:hypothetical protein